jgi:hypothetical protein
MNIEYVNNNFIIRPSSDREVEKLKELLGVTIDATNLTPCGNVGLHREDQSLYKD